MIRPFATYGSKKASTAATAATAGGDEEMVAAMPVERCALDVPSQQRRLARHTAGEQPQHDADSREMARRGWAEVELVEDAGFSAGSLRRPGLAYALKRLRAGEASVLVVFKMDRHDIGKPVQKGHADRSQGSRPIVGSWPGKCDV
jgi:hypothetical protein